MARVEPLRGVTIDNVRKLTQDSLSEVMDFGHVIASFGNGLVGDVHGVPAPEVNEWTDELGWHIEDPPKPWDLMNGYSGQQGYRGPWMHQSENIGGSMAQHILDRPGIYVAVYPSSLDEDPGLPDTWAVATLITPQ